MSGTVSSFLNWRLALVLEAPANACIFNSRDGCWRSLFCESSDSHHGWKMTNYERGSEGFEMSQPAHLALLSNQVFISDHFFGFCEVTWLCWTVGGADNEPNREHRLGAGGTQWVEEMDFLAHFKVIRRLWEWRVRSATVFAFSVSSENEIPDGLNLTKKGTMDRKGNEKCNLVVFRVLCTFQSISPEPFFIWILGTLRFLAGQQVSILERFQKLSHGLLGISSWLAVYLCPV